MDAEIKVPSDEIQELSKVPPLNNGTGQNRAVHVSSARQELNLYSVCFLGSFHFILSQSSARQELNLYSVCFLGSFHFILSQSSARQGLNLYSVCFLGSFHFILSQSSFNMNSSHAS